MKQMTYAFSTGQTFIEITEELVFPILIQTLFL